MFVKRAKDLIFVNSLCTLLPCLGNFFLQNRLHTFCERKYGLSVSNTHLTWLSALILQPRLS